MTKGIARHLDDLGRIVIPSEMRETLKIKSGDLLDIYFKDGVLCIDKCKLQCSTCGVEEGVAELWDVDGIIICDKCAEKIRKRYMRCVTK